MINFLVMYDSLVTEQEERIIELSLKEAADLFPNLELVLMQQDSNEYVPLADAAIEKSRSDENGDINAADVLYLASKGAGDDFVILFVAKNLYIDLFDQTKEQGEMKKVNNVAGVASKNAYVCSIGTFRKMDLEDQMHTVEHSVCNAIGQIIFGLEQECQNPTCMMHTVSSNEEILSLARKELHGQDRLCKKCRERLLGKIPVSARMTPSRIDYL